ncbi:ABC transporter ATP-binding protein [Tenggerimyces flavus]|uniref:ATP-binding cassette domain-containing protein n=1 Tax=Tenggerimyces flavus TaxID=1708749 RepID=A0ABV7YNE5_9ACTN|nr:ATP-binding cassette domain-containing protein [Tenggerimyces flavus]MBM7787796.1 ABC-2 type transport system ATP-binding protein [Tenggerimyces flavus]
MISAHDLTKTYTFHQQTAGLAGALKSLVKRKYETRLAVDQITFGIERGEVVGLLGPNGAGKTTTLKMLSGLLYITSGELQVLGFKPSDRKHDYLRRIALVMGQKTMLWWDVPAMESLLLHKDMYGLSTKEFERNVDELAELLDVKDLLNVQVRKTSLGERMKLELMAALVHGPEILFLDEPTIGLDVVAKARVREFLGEVNKVRGTTILVTSHDMDDIEALCSRVMIIDHGRLQYDGGLEELVRTARPRKLVRATYAEPIDGATLATLEGLTEIEGDSRVVKLEVERDQTGELLERLSRLGPLVDLDVADADIEEIMRDLFLREGKR